MRNNKIIHSLNRTLPLVVVSIFQYAMCLNMNSFHIRRPCHVQLFIHRPSPVGFRCKSTFNGYGYGHSPLLRKRLSILWVCSVRNIHFSSMEPSIILSGYGCSVPLTSFLYFITQSISIRPWPDDQMDLTRKMFSSLSINWRTCKWNMAPEMRVLKWIGNVGCWDVNICFFRVCRKKISSVSYARSPKD